jgi:hypothetical protein
MLTTAPCESQTLSFNKHYTTSQQHFIALSIASTENLKFVSGCALNIILSNYNLAGWKKKFTQFTYPIFKKTIQSEPIISKHSIRFYSLQNFKTNTNKLLTLILKGKILTQLRSRAAQNFLRLFLRTC